MVRVIITRSSVWQIDDERMEFRRSPRHGNMAHPVVAYHEGWQPYTAWGEGDEVDGVVWFVVEAPTSPTGSLYSSYRVADQKSDD
jgi:hypothetical protein